MKSLSDFFKKLNYCAERAFGPLPQQMIDKLLYAKLPAHLKRSINVAFSENGTYEQIVTQLEREVELSGLETDGELPIAKMTTTTTTINKQTQAQNAEKQQIICRYCKKPKHVIKECRKCIRKEQELQGEKQPSERRNAKTYPPCPHCRRTNHTPDVCWNGPNASNRPRRYKTQSSNHSTDDSHKPGTSTQNARHLFSRIILTKKTTTPLVTYNTYDPIYNL